MNGVFWINDWWVGSVIGGYGSMMTESMMEGSIMGGSGSMIGGSSQDWFDPMISGSGPMMGGSESMMSGSNLTLSKDHFKTPLLLLQD